MDKPVRIASVIILVVVIVGAVVANCELLVENFGRLALDHGRVLPDQPHGRLPRAALLRVERRRRSRASFEIGIHNATLAIVIAQTVLGSVELQPARGGLRRADVLHRVGVRLPHPRAQGRGGRRGGAGRRRSRDGCIGLNTGEPMLRPVARWRRHPLRVPQAGLPRSPAFVDWGARRCHAPVDRRRCAWRRS